MEELGRAGVEAARERAWSAARVWSGFLEKGVQFPVEKGSGGLLLDSNRRMGGRTETGTLRWVRSIDLLMGHRKRGRDLESSGRGTRSARNVTTRHTGTLIPAL